MKSVWPILVLMLALPAAALGQTPPVFPFAFDQDDLNGAPDFSFLNHPLTAADRVFVKNGHFYTVGRDLQPITADDQRVRFYGVSIAFGADFPDPSNGDAVRIAKRLRRLGINLVRLHHMDSEPDPIGDTSEFNSTLTVGPYPSFNTSGLARLRAFLTALENEGIYVDLNLHVGYTFRPDTDPGIPYISGFTMPDQSKPLQAMYPPMIALQQQYAQGLITQLQLQGDPVLAMVEISNESSVVSAWQWGQLEPVLVGDYRTQLQNEWNAWLLAKYGNTAALAAAWGPSTPDGPNILTGNWQLEVHSPAVATMSTITTNGIPTQQVHVSTAGNWVFLKQTGFTMRSGHHYRLTFQARADLANGVSATLPISIMRDDSPWNGYSVAPYQVSITSQWQTFNALATATFDILGDGRAMVEVDGVGADTYVRSMTLVQAGQNGLGSGQTLEAGNLPLPSATDNPTPQRLNDYAAFLTWVDQHYVETIRDTVRAATDALVPITGTQMYYGGLSLLDSQNGLDYQDNHFYIDHPQFPGIAWDPWDWHINDQAAADDTWGALTYTAWAREAGRPYTVSEYNQPWPNRHGTEIDPTLAAFAAFQDWDGIMHFDYAGGRNWDSPIPSAFDLNGDWTKFPLTGQAAWLFRSGAVKPSAATVDMPVSAAQRLQATIDSQAPQDWAAAQYAVSPQLPLTRAVELAKDSSAPLPPGAANPTPVPYVSDTGELTFDPTNKLFLLSAAQAAAVSGNIGAGNTATSGPIDVQLSSADSGFATVLVTALDNAAIARSGRLLVSAPGYALRSLPSPGEQPPAAGSAAVQGIVNYLNTSYWTIDPTNAYPTWGGWVGKKPPSGNMDGGYTPTFMTRVECWLTLRTYATAPVVTALDGAGNPVGTLPASEIQAVSGGYRVHLNGTGQTASPWFVVSLTPPPAPTISASPNPIHVAAGAVYGQTTITWNALGYQGIEVHVNSPTGATMATGGSSGSAATGLWVADGTRFYLVDAATHAELAMVPVFLNIRHKGIPKRPGPGKRPQSALQPGLSGGGGSKQL